MTAYSTSSSLSSVPESDDENAIVVAGRLGLDTTIDSDTESREIVAVNNDAVTDHRSCTNALDDRVSRASSSPLSDLSSPPQDLPDNFEEFVRQRDARVKNKTRDSTDEAEGRASPKHGPTEGPAQELLEAPGKADKKPAVLQLPEKRLEDPGVPIDVPTTQPTEPPKGIPETIVQDEISKTPPCELPKTARPASVAAHESNDPPSTSTDQPSHTETLARPAEIESLKLPTDASVNETDEPTPVAQEEGHDAQSMIEMEVPEAGPSAQAPIEPRNDVVNDNQTDERQDGSPRKRTKSHGSSEAFGHIGSDLRLSLFRDETRHSFESSLGAMADQSEFSSVPSLVSSKATTPAEADISTDVNGSTIPPSSQQPPAPSTPKATPPHTVVAEGGQSTTPTLLIHPHSQPVSSLLSTPLPHLSPSLMPRLATRPQRPTHQVKPKASIPTNMPLYTYASQCVAAAESSRLNPYGLHQEEHTMLRHHISPNQVTTYLNLRNGILRLWMRNPMNAVKRQDAIGCAKDRRWFDVADVCFDWLVRRGFINYGCAKMERNPIHHEDLPPKQLKRGQRVIVIGAGMAGLGCARQLEALFTQYADQLDTDRAPPEVIILEGRNRIGGRVYSRAFQRQPETARASPAKRHSRATAEMGGMIITGFDRGNPLNVLLRGQLGLSYHPLLSETTIYDIDGKPVDIVRDGLVENLFNECLDRVSEFKFKLPQPKVTEGNYDLINEGRDSTSESHRTLAQVEDTKAAEKAQRARDKTAAILASLATGMPDKFTTGSQSPGPSPRPPDLVPVSSDRLTGRSHMEPGTLGSMRAAYKVKAMGWSLKPGVEESTDLDLDPPAHTEGATLGYVVEEAIEQYRSLIDLDAQDLRLLNWHIANLEYSNAINQNCLSLKGWDIDAGNEWEGKHSMVIGGYQSVLKGLMLVPTPLTVHRSMVVKKIVSREDVDGDDDGHRQGGAKYPMTVECEGDHSFEADFVVNTIPLGVLKDNTVEFDPPLPSWKAGVIQRLGYGVLNKIVLSFAKPFWDQNRDIFGVLRAPNNPLSLNQKEYAKQRGRMFQWFNVTPSTGLPCLLALMAGDAAYDTENSTDEELVEESLSVLRSVFGAETVSQPIEVMITRWASDRFSRGSYSSAGPDMLIDDYDTMARRVGRRHFFAGEHTIGTHPATVHGAYLSGLRAASDVIDEMLGPIRVPSPLIIPKEADTPSLKRKLTLLDDDTGTGGEDSSSSFGGGGTTHREAKANLRRQLEARERQILEHIESKIGVQPTAPSKVVDNSYLLFSKANYNLARKKCEEGRRPGKGRLLPNEVRVLTSKMWRSASPNERQPFAEQAARQKQEYLAALQDYNVKAAEWNAKASELRLAYDEEHPPPSLNNNNNGTVNGISRKQPLTPEPATRATPGSRSSPGGRTLRRLASNRASSGSDVEMTG